jgi:hypothetical protein
MPKRGALLAVVIMERPLCLDCISEKIDLTTDDIRGLLSAIEGTVSLNRDTDRCRACGRSTTVYSVFRDD